jgi:hypothetical protein
MKKNMQLNDKLLFKVWEYSLFSYHNKIRGDEPNNIFTARLWVEGLFLALKNEGYEVCIKQNGKEVYSLKQSV